MPCKRVKCAQCLMVLKNQTHRAKQFLIHLNNSHTFNAYAGVPFTSLPRFARCAHNEDIGIPQVEEYLLTPNEPYLSIEELTPALMDPNPQGDYQVWAFNTIWIRTSSQSSLRSALILSKCIMKSDVYTSLHGAIGSMRTISARCWRWSHCN